MSSKGRGHNNKFVRFITVPFRVLGKAKDLYVRSMTSCASRANLGQGCDDYILPRSFSASSATSFNKENEDFRELIRAASARSLGHRNEMEMFLQEQLKQMRSSKESILPKSCSVGMGRIDEDKSCEFEDKDCDDDDDVVVVRVGNNKKEDSLFKRSRSYAVTKRNSVASDSY